MATNPLPEKYNRYLDAIFQTEKKISECLSNRKDDAKDDVDILTDNWICQVEDALANPIARMYIARALNCPGVAKLCEKDIASDKEHYAVRHGLPLKVQKRLRHVGDDSNSSK